MNRKLLMISIICNIALVLAFFILIRSLGGWNYFLYKIQNRGLAGLYQHRKEQLDLLPLHATDIVFLGNSITEQGEWAELLSNPNVRNRGIAGDGTEGVLQRLPAILAAKPKAVCLMIGVNDLYFHPPKYVIKHYTTILQAIKTKTPNTVVLVQSILPVNNQVKNTRISNDDIRKTNSQVRELASQLGYTYLDLSSHFTDEAGHLDSQYTVDGIHINGRGYRHWRDILLTQYTELFQ